MSSNKKPLRYLHLTIKPKGPIDYDALKVELDKAADWLRYTPTCYILWTRRSAQEWYERLRRVPAMSLHSSLLFAADMSDRQGWISKSVWTWLAKHDHKNPYQDALLRLLSGDTDD